VAEREEKNAWQADALIDRILLVLMLAAVVFALLTAITRASGARPTKGLGPAGATALIAAGAAILVAYRIIQEPGLDAGTNVKAGAPLALLALGMIGLGASSALRADDRDEEETADAGAD
jgi:drug/metabolite transporter (DMT)-like permease